MEKKRTVCKLYRIHVESRRASDVMVADVLSSHAGVES